MRSEEEVKAMFDAIGEQDSDPTSDDSRPPILAWQGDTFKYGYLIGRIHALAWMLGADAADVRIDYDFEDYVRELQSRIPPMPPPPTGQP